MTREQAVNFLLEKPYLFAHMLGFTKLTELHNGWIIDMVRGKEDKTLQAHRGSYKTTCVSIALAIIIILMPRKKTLFMRKTDTDVKEVIKQVQKILLDPHTLYFVQVIYGTPLRLTVSSATEINTNLATDIKGTSQLVGIGTQASLTGKHFDCVFTDDIVNVNDRISRAERDRTKLVYQELQNIRNRGGRIYNTGTPWSKDDAFTLMPNIERFDCYQTGLIPPEDLEQIKASMTASLFAANYELRHVAEEDVIFSNPRTDCDTALVEQGDCHIDAAYGGEDYTAFTIVSKRNGNYYFYGRLWRKHVDDCLDEIQGLRKRFNAGRIYCEDNGDKGYLAKELRKRGERAVTYHENMNKFLKITSYLKAEWNNVYFVSGTDKEFIDQICDYNENAEHDDAPDSVASQVRRLWRKNSTVEKYQSILS
jgi:phage terminase large subunit-like protein|nr:MAG TPA: Terminase large subunit [Caudoviricetes sp.]